MKKEVLKYWNAINQNLKIGPVRFKKLYNYFESIKQAFFASASELKEAGIEENITEYFIEKRKRIDPDLEMEKLEKENIEIITILDKSYPRILKEIYNPPPLLYIKGNFQKSDELSIAVVGTRKPSPYGKQVALEIVRDLTKQGITIISGLAIGIDSIVHDCALKNKGRTIAVLGSGLDQKSIYPSSNKKLARQIMECGAVITEFPLNTPPLKHHFPSRNRIISGLSLGTLIIEAPEKSGALITANYALEQNREIFAIPGNIYSSASFGPNDLIKKGAKLTSCASDILNELNLSLATEYTKKQEIVPETKEEAILLKFLNKEPTHIDKLIRKTGLTTAAINSTLTLMEIKGKIKNLGGMNYIITR